MSFYVVRHGEITVDAYLVEAENADEAIANYERGYHLGRLRPRTGPMALIKAGPFETEQEAIDAELHASGED